MIGKTILQYEIIEQIGEGGMGTVYKAKDTKLDRFVALKFLPSQVVTSEEEKARFVQEAKAASAMNHPNVCTIYDIQEFEKPSSLQHSGTTVDKQLFIVMEFIDGSTLRDIKQTLSEKRILDIGIQAAEGLAAAHEKGIVHRDIKPENIMIRKDGIAQIMDFGLAKLYSSSNVSRLTKAGTTMGTMGYMSPEQVQGLDVDHRSDIFSLGVVLYELFAGESPFKGMHETAIMYEIVNVEAPPIATVKQDIDPQLDGLILECLEKDKDERCQSAKELAKNLRKIKRVSTGNRTSRIYNVNTAAFSTANQQTGSKSSGSIAIEAFNKRFELGKILKSGVVPWSIILILLLSVLYMIIFNNPQYEPGVTTTASILPPDNALISNGQGGSLQISPDGKMFVFYGRDTTDNRNKLWIRPINSPKARALTFAGNRSYPFWSPDGKFIAFFNKGKLKKIDINSSLPIIICDAKDGRGGTWNKEGIIVFAPDATGGLYKVSANGGTPTIIIKSDTTNSEQSLRFPFFLPDGKHFLYSVEQKFSGASSKDAIKVGSLENDNNKIIITESSNAQYANGFIFFIRQSTLMCQRFDTDKFKLKGNAQTISGDINYSSPLIKGAFTVSNAGNLIAQNVDQRNLSIAIFDIINKKNSILFHSKILYDLSYSPDDKKILFAAPDEEGKNSIIWRYDISRKITSRITFKSNFARYPIWSPDGEYISYAAFNNGNYDIFLKYSDGSGKDSLIYHSDYFKSPKDWSSDGNTILISALNGGPPFIETLQINNKNKVNTFSTSIFQEFPLAFTKNGEWIIYATNETGTFQLYAKPFNGGRGKFQITTNSGFFIGLINDGKELVYVNNNKLYKIKINVSKNNFTVGSPKLILDLNANKINNVYDITEDGKKILVNTTTSLLVVPPFTYIQNWKGMIQKSE